MRDVLAKTDNTGDTLTADAFNANLRTEIQAVVTDTGQTLDPEAGPDTDQDMLGKAIATYASDGGFYQDSGAADAYVLGRAGNIQPVPAYFVGQQIVFVAGNTNTGASTVNVTTLGSKDIRKVGGAVLNAGDIVSGEYIICRFDFANDYFEYVNFSAAAAVPAVLQTVTKTNLVGTTTSASIPYDDTSPQITEGGAVDSITITPLSASSTLVVRFYGLMSVTTSLQKGILAVFRDSAVDAISVCCAGTDQVDVPLSVFTTAIVASGALTPTTFSFRFGAQGSNCTIGAVAPLLGGANIITMEIIELS